MPFVPILMYHEVQDSSRPNPAAAASWVVDVADFRRQMDRLANEGYTGLSVTRWLAERGNTTARPVVLTFDDGHIGNLDFAVPALLEKGWTGTFFIATGKLREAGYANPERWGEASAHGMDIASHGVSHSPLGALDDEGVLRELMQSRLTLEEAIGVPVVGFSWPHGDVPQGGADLLRTAGYRWAATSRESLASDRDDVFSLPRLPVRSWHGPNGLTNLLADDPVSRLRMFLRYRAKQLARRLLGRGRYSQLQGNLSGDVGRRKHS